MLQVMELTDTRAMIDSADEAARFDEASLASRIKFLTGTGMDF